LLLERIISARQDSLVRSTRVTDGYIFVWLCIAFAVCAFASFTETTVYHQAICLLLGTFRVSDIVGSCLLVGLFAHHRQRRIRLKGAQVASAERVVILGIVNLMETSLWFASVYSVFANHLVSSGGLPLSAPVGIDGFYFSVVTQMTIGFGDIHPTGWLRLAVIIQTLVSLLLLVVLIGRFAALSRRVESASARDERDVRHD
jgi:hypothetical protein